MAATSEGYIKLAQSLPLQLLRFFTRYKPRLVKDTTSTFTSTASTALTPNTQEATTLHHRLEPSDLPNPFRSFRNPETGEWRDPIYSLRRQADLVKMARVHGIERLLPHTVKATDARIQRRAEHGLRVKGTGIGQRVKGKAWERTMKGRLEKRKQAMEGMPNLIHEWKMVSEFSLRRST